MVPLIWLKASGICHATSKLKT